MAKSYLLRTVLQDYRSVTPSSDTPVFGWRFPMHDQRTRRRKITNYLLSNTCRAAGLFRA